MKVGRPRPPILNPQPFGAHVDRASNTMMFATPSGAAQLAVGCGGFCYSKRRYADRPVGPFPSVGQLGPHDPAEVDEPTGEGGANVMNNGQARRASCWSLRFWCRRPSSGTDRGGG
jgi:hypothetical protein